MVKPSVKAWTVEEELFRLWFTIIYHVGLARARYWTGVPVSRVLI